MRSPHLSSLSNNPGHTNILNIRFMRRIGLLGWLLSLGLALGLLPSSVLAGNHTIDDSDNTINFSTGWNIGNTCTGCFAQPTDRSSIYGQTWRDATRGNASTAVISFEYSFTGTGVYVYGIIINIVETTFVFTTNNDMKFFIDGTQAGTFVHAPADTDSYQYNVEMFGQTGLADTAHTLRAELNPNSVFLFDYLVYQTPDPTTTTSASSSSASSVSSTTLVSSSSSLSRLSPFSDTSAIGFSTFTNDPFGSSSSTSTPTSSSSSKKLATGAIAGIAVGGIAVIAFLILLAFFLIRRNQTKGNPARPLMAPHPGGSANEQLVHGHGLGGPGGPGGAPYMSMANSSNHHMNAYMPPSMYSANDLGNSGGRIGGNALAGAGVGTALAVGAGSAVATSPETIANSTMNSKQRLLQEQSQGYQASNQSREDFSPPVPAWARDVGRESSVGSGTVVTDLGSSSSDSPQGGPYAGGGGQSYHPYANTHPAQYAGIPMTMAGQWNAQASLYPHGVPPHTTAVNPPGPGSASDGYTESAYTGLGSSQSGGDGLSYVGGLPGRDGVLGAPAHAVGVPGAVALQRHESAFMSRPGTAPPPYQIPASPPPLSPESRVRPPPREKR